MGDSRKPIERPRIFAKRFVESADLAAVFDMPCSKHKGTKPKESRGCDRCDRWDTQKTRRWMRSRGLAAVPRSKKRGRIYVTVRCLLELEGVGDALLQRMTPDEVQALFG